MMKRAFFSQHTTQVAKALIGKKLVWFGHEGIITETEAYRGQDDPASHAYGKRTTRNQLMYERPGLTYVYMIYGMYHCLNIVCETKGEPGAVLIRGIKTPKIHLDGPGKTCKHLQITREHNGLDALAHPDIFITEHLKKPTINVTTRIGISKAKDKLWRFVLSEQ